MKALFQSVTGEYSSNNLLKFDGKSINPENFPGGVFMIALNGGFKVGGAAIYIVALGETNNIDNVALNMLCNAGSTYPGLTRTTSGNIAALWKVQSGTSSYTANIRTSIFRLN